MILPSSYTPFQRGVDMALHFQHRPFTISDIAARYEVLYRAAWDMLQRLHGLGVIEHVGYGDKPTSDPGPAPDLWRFV